MTISQTVAVRDMASLHPSTVTNYRDHLPKRKAGGPRAKISTVRVDPRVWKTALRLAQNDATRLIVRSTTEVLVVNRSRRSVAGIY